MYFWITVFVRYQTKLVLVCLRLPLIIAHTKAATKVLNHNLNCTLNSTTFTYDKRLIKIGRCDSPLEIVETFCGVIGRDYNTILVLNTQALIVCCDIMLYKSSVC